MSVGHDELLRCVVCIVMDKLDGGDLVEGLQRHLKELNVV